MRAFKLLISVQKIRRERIKAAREKLDSSFSPATPCIAVHKEIRQRTEARAKSFPAEHS